MLASSTATVTGSAAQRPAETYKIAQVPLLYGPLQGTVLSRIPRLTHKDASVLSSIEQMFPEPREWPGSHFDVLLTRFDDAVTTRAAINWDPSGFGMVHPRLLASTITFHPDLAKRFGPFYLIGSQEGVPEDDEADPKVGLYCVAHIGPSACTVKLMPARDIDNKQNKWFTFSVGRWRQ